MRRWPRRALVGANIAVTVALVGSTLALVYVRYRYDQIRKVDVPGLVHGGRDSAGPVLVEPPVGGKYRGPATTILLVGNNSRSGLDPSESDYFGTPADAAGAHSDVTMLLHLDPVKGATILSIPRDLFVPLPPHSVVGSVGKIDAALNNGPEQLVETITNDLGIPINHYVSVNFDGFQHVIDSLGGVNMSFPLPLRDAYSGLNIVNTGCQHLDGAEALAVVRARHLQYKSDGRWLDDPESDLSRIRRDHEFLTVLAKTIRAKGLTNPLRANAVVGNLVNQVTIDNALSVSYMLDLLRSYGGLNPDTTPELTLPVTLVPGLHYYYEDGDYGSVVFPSEPADAQTIAQFLGTEPVTTLPESIQVVDRSGIGAGTRVGHELTDDGFDVTSVTYGAERATPSETVIHYQPGDLPAAQAVLGSLSGAAVMFADTQTPASTIVVDVGSVLAVSGGGPVVASPAASTPSTTATTVPTPDDQPISPSAAPLDVFDPRGC